MGGLSLPYRPFAARVIRLGGVLPAPAPSLATTRKERAMDEQTSSTIGSKAQAKPRGPKPRGSRTDLFGVTHRCCQCDRWLDEKMFHKAKANVSNGGLSYKCKACDRKYQLKRYAELDDENRTKRYQSNRKYMLENTNGRAIAMVNNSKQRSRKQGWENTIKASDVVSKIIEGRCEATGVKFRYERSEKGITPFSPSIDRINSSEGYTKANIQVVCSMYNIGKGAHNELDFIAMCILVAERNKDNGKAIARARELVE